MPEAWIYILECADGSYYTGITDNLELRLNEHHTGEGCPYTKSRLPVKLVFLERMPTKNDAYLAEQQIKGWSHAKKKALINGDWELVRFLAKKPKFRKE